MTAFFQSILSGFQAIVSLIVNLVVGSYQLVTMIPQAFNYLTTSIGYLPAVFSAAATAMLTVSVVMLIIGRE